MLFRSLNGFIDIHYAGFSATWHTNFVSRQYITNTEDRDFSLPCYSQSDLSLNYSAKLTKALGIKGKRCPDLLGVKGVQPGMQVRCEISGLNPETAFETVCLECRRGNRNSLCSGEMRRYKEEHQWRRRITGR